MFKKLITNLPFNPSLLTQVTFYAKRLRKEESIRRLGFGFMALAMFTQVFAVVAPPQKSLASASGDYIINGLKTRDDILRAWDGKTNDQNVATIYGRFGLTRSDIEALPMMPNKTITTSDADYWTIGRSSLSAVSRAGKIKQEYKDAEIPVVAGASTVYLRQLKAWDIINPVNSYKAFEGTKNGQKFWILVDCGNFTQVGVPPLNNPQIVLRKTIDGGPRALKPGESFAFRFEYRNTVQDSTPAQNVVLTDTLDLDHFEIVSSTNLPLTGNTLNYPIGSVPYSADYKLALTITVRLKTDLDNGSKVCNAAKLTASNAGEAWGGGPGLCVNILNPCPIDSSVPSATDPRCVNPTLVCSLTVSELNRATKEATFTTTVTSSNPSITKIASYAYSFGDNGTKSNASTALTDTIKHTYKDGTYNATVTVNYRINTTSGATSSIACAGEVDTKPDQPLTPTKLAQNITQSLSAEKTATTKAKAGDVIEYTLNIHNSFSYDRANYTISDYVGDILDYAYVDQAFLTAQGGSYNDQTKTITYAPQTVKANGDVSKKFRVTVKDPIPATNQPGSMTTAFDCVISNKYGSEVSIPINCPPAKTAEYIASTLPKTGPGTSLAIGFGLTMIIAYFFARSRLLGKEMELIRSEYAAGGGF